MKIVMALIFLENYETLGPGTVKFLLKYSKLEFMVPGPNTPPVVGGFKFLSRRDDLLL